MSIFKRLFVYFFIAVICNWVLSSNAQQPKLVLPVAPGLVTSLKFSQHDKFVISTGEFEPVKIWDANTGSYITELPNGDRVSNVEFSPDYKKILVEAGQGIKIWNTETLDLQYKIEEGIFALSADFKKILLSRFNNTIEIWDIETNNLVDSLVGHSTSVETIAISAGNNKAASYDQDSTVIIWDLKLRKVLQKFKSKTVLIGLEFLNNEKKIVLKSENSMQILDLATNTSQFVYENKEYFVNIGTVKKRRREKSHHGEDLKVYKFLNNEKNLLIQFDSKIEILNVADLKVATAFEDCYKYAELTISKDEKFALAIDSTEKIASIWSIETGKKLFNLKDFGHKIYAAGFVPNSHQIYTESDDGIIRFISLNTGEVIDEFSANAEAIRFFSLSNDGKKFIGMLSHQSSSNQFKIWSTKTKKELVKMYGHTVEPTKVTFSPDNKKILIVLKDQSVKIWDLTNPTPLLSLQPSARLAVADFDQQGNVLAGSWHGKLNLYNANTGALQRSTNDLGRLHFLAFSNDYKTFATYVGDSTNASMLNGNVPHIFSNWDAITGKMINSFEIPFLQTYEKLPKTGKIITIEKPEPSIINYDIKIWDFITGKQLLKVNSNVSEASFSIDEDLLLIIKDKRMLMLNIKLGDTILAIDNKNEINHVKFSEDGKNIISYDYNYTKIWDAKTGKLIEEKPSKESNYVKHTVSSNEKQKLIYRDDLTFKVWDVKKNKLLYNFLVIDSNDYFMQVPSGYYLTTPRAAKLIHYLTKDLKIITFEQLDVRYNRPDKVLEETGSTDTALIQSYKKAYEKRVKKLGIDTTSFKSGYSVPEADFKNRDVIEYELNKQQLSLHIIGSDNTYNLDRFNVWVNENPIFGMRGINIRKRNKKMIDTTIYITLSDGPNQIETSITNINGTESYRMPLNVNYTPEKKAVEKLYFVGIGIDQFMQSQNNLQWSVKDVRDQAKALKLKYGNNISIDTLFNQNVTVNNIRALKEKLKLSGVNDKVFIAYSGHGMLSSDYDYFLSTYSVNFNKPQQNGLPYDDLEDLLDNIPARKKLMLIDACHSGEVDKEELLKYSNAENVLAVNKTSGARGVKVINTGQKKAGMKTSMELMQQLFVNVGRSTGATVISAAAGTQFALEKSDLKNGVFSYSILEYMLANPHATVNDLKKHVNKRVVELTAGLQVPTTRNETNTIDWNVW